MTQQAPTDRLLTPNEVSEILGVMPDTLAHWRYSDKERNVKRYPTHIKVGRLIRYRQSDIDAWLEEQAS